MAPSKSFSVSDNGSQVVYLRGYPRYDAVRVDIDSANSSSTSVDLTFKIDSNDEVSEVESNGFSNMDATVHSVTGIDGSAGDPSEGTTAVGRVVAVEVVENDTTTGTENVSGTVSLHQADDPAQSASAFANR